LPVVFVSADPADIPPPGPTTGPTWFVEKPFLPSELLAAVHGAMGIPQLQVEGQAASALG
jgi:hypothetical protein